MRRFTSARISQLLFLALFLILFVQTEYRGDDQISAAVNSFFRADPLVSVSYLFAAKSFTWLVFPGIVVLGLTILLGRFFCGWICPLGTILDLVTGKIAKTAPIHALKGNLKYFLLIPLLTCSLFGVNLAGLLDPLALLVRALSSFFYPVLGDSVRQGWVALYRVMGEKRDLLAPGYDILRDHILPFRETFYPLAFLSAALFALILFLERYETRNWCRNLCPLGTLLGIAGRFSLFNRLPKKLCPDCGTCHDLCPTSFGIFCRRMSAFSVWSACSVARHNGYASPFQEFLPVKGPISLIGEWSWAVWCPAFFWRVFSAFVHPMRRRVSSVLLACGMKASFCKSACAVESV